MSHWDSDADHHDYLNGPYARLNAVCVECGDEFWKGRDEIGDLCDSCISARDAWRVAYETRHPVKPR